MGAGPGVELTLLSPLGRGLFYRDLWLSIFTNFHDPLGNPR